MAAGLAKKSRTPPPPRRPVQAPKRRADVRAPRERRQLLYLVIFAASGLVMLGGVLLLLGLTGNGGGGGSSGLAATMREAGCTYKQYKLLPASHVRDGVKVKYNSFPPTSGNHYQQPAIWNLYDAPLEQERLVHNLEHGGLVIQYGSKVPESTANELREFYLSDPNGMILAPLPRLGGKFALTTWRHLATCPSFDKGAFSKFREERRYKGAEPFRPEDLAPGT